MLNLRRCFSQSWGKNLEIGKWGEKFRWSFGSLCFYEQHLLLRLELVPALIGTCDAVALGSVWLG